MKRGLSIVLVLMLLVSLVPLPALAAGEGYETITGSIMFNAGHDDMETDHPCPFTYSDGYTIELPLNEHDLQYWKDQLQSRH